MEQRKRARVALKIDCRIAPADGRAACRKRTENISRTGLLIRWTEAGCDTPAPEVGDALTIEVELPPNSTFSRRCMQFEAGVVRVFRGEDNTLMIAVKAKRSGVRPLVTPPEALELIRSAYLN